MVFHQKVFEKILKYGSMILFFNLSLGLSGCASVSPPSFSEHLNTEIASFPQHHLQNHSKKFETKKLNSLSINQTNNQALNNQAPYDHIAVYATSIDDLIFKQKIENAFCKAMNPTPCVSMLSLFPPFLDYSQSESLQRLKSNHIDAILLISVNKDETNLNQTGANTYQVRQKITLMKDLKLIKSNPAEEAYLGQDKSEHKDMEETQTRILPALSRQSAGKMLLIDTQSGQPVWGGAFQTEGQGHRNINDVAFAQSEALPVVKALKNAGLLENKKRDQLKENQEKKISSHILSWLIDPNQANQVKKDSRKTSVIFNPKSTLKAMNVNHVF